MNKSNRFNFFHTRIQSTIKIGNQIIARFRANRKIISRSYLVVRKKDESTQTATEEWMLDNYSLILDTLKTIGDNLKPKFFLNFPLSQDEVKSIRVYGEMTRFINSNSSHITSHRLSHFIKLVQEKNTFDIAELWAIPTILKVILIEKFSLISEKVLQSKNSVVFIDSPREVRKIIISLQNLNEINWIEFVEEHSFLEKILKKDPAGIYPKMDPRTRDIYRHSLEEIAIRTKVNEKDIANWLIETSKEEKEDIGEFLLGNHRKSIENVFGYKKTSSQYFSLLLKNNATFLYIVSQLLIFVSLIVLIVLHLKSFLEPSELYKLKILAFLLLIPTLEVGVIISNFLVTKLVRPQILYKMDAGNPLPVAQRTLVVIPTLLFTNIDVIDNLISNIKNNYLTNQDPNIFFALLVAFPQTSRSNGTLTSIENDFLNLLKKRVEELNVLYPSSNKRFLLFYRQRVWSSDENTWGEWERKRGKILEFNQLLRGNSDTTYKWHNSEISFLKTIKYVITIDQDVSLLRDNAKNLVATISHPLNQAKLVLDSRSKEYRVVSGYGIVQPRLGVAGDEINSYSLTRSLFGDHSGWDSYSFAQSNVYQDLFNEGFYLGKGIYEVDIFNKVLTGRLPLNTLLSHDHIEGFYCRTAYASDIQVYEDFPKNYLSYRTRLERWIRGDWQRSYWLFKWIKNQKGERVRNPLKIYQKWKLFQDNIQSLFLPSLFVLIISSWLIFPSFKYPMMGYVLFFLILPSIFGLVSKLGNFKNLETFSFGIFRILENLKSASVSVIFYVVFLADHFFFILGAIFRASFRIAIVKKNRLQWTTFYEISISSIKNTRHIDIFKKYILLEITIGILLFGIYLFQYESLLITLPLLVIWALTPIFESKLNGSTVESIPLFNKLQQNNLNIIARRTWRYFEHFANSENNFLPPDLYQPGPPAVISRMTSITSIGIYLMTNFSAHDLGHISFGDLLKNFERSFSSISKLQRYKGHFFNWYDVKNLTALNPLYISTVDSGNFAGSLISVRQGLLQLPHLSIFRKENLVGLSTLLEIIKYELASIEQNSVERNKTLSTFIQEIEKRTHSLGKNRFGNLYNWLQFYKNLHKTFKDNPTSLDVLRTDIKYKELPFWFNALEGLIDNCIKDLEKIIPTAGFHISNLSENHKIKNALVEIDNSLYKSESLVLLEFAYSEAKKRLIDIEKLTRNNAEKKELEDYIKSIFIGSEYVSENLASCRKLSDLANKYVNEMNFEFLYNENRSLFRIGYNLSKKRFDRSHYDLLASESRLASYIAIAKNNVPLKHWSALSRKLTVQRGKIALLSWGGSVFEYLFPLLVLPKINNSILSESYESIIENHISYARKNRILWGISESSFSQLSKDGIYGYKLHGVQALSLKQYPFDDLVVSTYSSFLGLEIKPQAAYENIVKLQNSGAETNFGFYEALDFNKYNFKEEKNIFVKTFLSHHQGTILISISNILTSVNAKTRFISDALMHSSQFLLEEKIPNTVEVFKKPKKVLRKYNYDERKEAPARNLKKSIKILQKEIYSVPLMSVLSNGDYSIFINSRGSGYSKYKNKQLTNWSNDPTLDQLGYFILLEDLDTKAKWSATFQPARVAPESYEVISDENSIKFKRTNNNIESELSIEILPNKNLEIRTLSIKNLSIHGRLLEVKSYAEIVLAEIFEYISHPVWSKMGIESSVSAENYQFFRRQRPMDQAETWLGFRLISDKPLDSPIQSITSKREFNSTKNEGHQKYDELDPIMGTRLRVHLNSQETKRFYYISGIANSHENIRNLINSYSDYKEIQKVLSDKLNVGIFTTEEYWAIQQILSCIVYKRGARFKKTFNSAEIILVQLGIDKNIPTCTIETGFTPSLRFLSEILKLFQYLWDKGVIFKVVILVSDTDNYYKPILEKVRNYINGHKAEEHLIIIEKANISEAEHQLIHAISKVSVNISQDTFLDQIETEFNKI